MEFLRVVWHVQNSRAEQNRDEKNLLHFNIFKLLSFPELSIYHEVLVFLSQESQLVSSSTRLDLSFQEPKMGSLENKDQ